MERLKRTRAPLRSSVTRIVHELEREMVKEDADRELIESKAEYLAEISQQLEDLDQRVLNQLLDDDGTEEEQTAEFNTIEEYRMKVITIKNKVNKFLRQDSPPISPTHSSCGFSTAVSTIEKKKSFKLPKIQLKKYNGELTEWLGWWAQFEKIHTDEDLHVVDKFQYLIQAVVPNTRAHTLVSSYPQTSENYPKVIEALKDRFGDKKLLAEVYVRKLQSLVFANVGRKEKIILSSMYDELESNLRSLESLGITTQHSALFLYPLIESSLPEELIKVWQRSPHSGYDDEGKDRSVEERLKSLMKFLRQEVKGEERLSFVKAGLKETIKEPQQKKEQKPTRPRNHQYKEDDIPTAAGLFSGLTLSCCFCDKGHQSHECVTAQSMGLGEKKSSLREKKRCYICFKPGHSANNCKTVVKCIVCGKKHHALMCPDLHQKKQEENSREEGNTTTVQSNSVKDQVVLLMTLLVRLETPNGALKLRVLMDTGSQRSYIRKDVVTRTNCQLIGSVSERNALFGGVLTDIKERKIYKVLLKSLNGRNSKFVELLDKQRIAGGIPQVPVGAWREELKVKKIWLPDIQAESGEIDILIGADMMPRMLTGRLLSLDCGLTAQETIFGWTLMGPVNRMHENPTATSMMVSSLLVADMNPSQLWELDVLGIRDPFEAKTIKQKEEEVKKYFLETVDRDPDGRYQVCLPWVGGGAQKILNNKSIAEKRLVTATRKLKSDSMFGQYDKIFRNWVEESFIEECHEPICTDEIPCHYLPHRPVYKPGSKTTPVRPVFDASCKVGRHPSLNDCLEKGPNYIELIPSIMMRFRANKIGLSADIRKAFQMIEVKESDRDYLRFLWWEDESCEKLKIFRHCRVVFGANCSPFLLGAVVDHHLSNVQEEDKPVAEKIKQSLYVDNVLTSVTTPEEYDYFKENSIRIMNDAKMELREWECTAVEAPGINLLHDSGCGLGDGGELASSHNLQAQETMVLGMVWDKGQDTLSCVAIPNEPKTISKRTILSTIQKVFDPMGFYSPAMILPKRLLQEIWIQEKTWDEELPEEITTQFGKWLEELNCLEKISVPRSMTGGQNLEGTLPEMFQLHVFCDASKYAYAAIVYLRTELEDEVHVQLLQSKARVAPIKKMTIPRLELMGCVIAARLAQSVLEALKMEIPVRFWSDSTTALAWIKRNDEWGTFVGNRAREICKLSDPEDWKHVPGILNPADLPSRGCTPKELLTSKWWEGPSWLKRPKAEWPVEQIYEDEEIIGSEKKKSATTTMSILNESKLDVLPFLSFQRNLDFVISARRFITFARGSTSTQARASVDEIEGAEMKIWKVVQKSSFITQIKTRKGVEISGMRVEEVDGIFRVKTKLINLKDTTNFRLPILLPRDHKIVHQLIMAEHVKNSHGGVQFMMSHLREKYWILSGRRTIKSILRSCVRCQRYHVREPVTAAAPLPEDRVKSSHVFEITGVDLAGPLFLKGKSKIWIVLFTCAVYRAVHLELVKSLDTDSFLLALSRFISRRGRPSIIYSDNGTNFVGANNLFNELDWNKISRESYIKRIQWKFNPPTAAWWGGFWERLVGTVKGLLKKSLGNGTLDYFQMETVLCGVEAVVNSRPLTVVSEDPQDLIPLTPAMFLGDLSRVSSFPELEELNDKGFQKKYRIMQQMLKELKKRFRIEYLSTLIQKGKGGKCHDMKVGDVVLIGQDNMKRILWPMARVVDIFPGKDGVVRVARVKTAKGLLLRPIRRLFPLEMEISPERIAVNPEVIVRAKVAKRDLEKETEGSQESQPARKSKACKENGQDPKGAEKNLHEDCSEILVTRSGRKVSRPVRFQ